MKKWLLFTMLAAALTAAAQQPDRRQRSAAERQLRQQRFMERLDSMVASGDFQFLPVSMEWAAGRLADHQRLLLLHRDFQKPFAGAYSGGDRQGNDL